MRSSPYRSSSRDEFAGLFVAEGSSDAPLAAIVESLFLERGFIVRLSAPDFSRLERTPKNVRSRVSAGLTLLESSADVVVHRDADNVGAEARLSEIETAVLEVGREFALVPVIPIRMTEAWLLLDEQAIRQVAGNPNGRVRLALPTLREVERVADPKTRLRDCLLAASDAAGYAPEPVSSAPTSVARETRPERTGLVAEGMANASCVTPP